MQPVRLFLLAGAISISGCTTFTGLERDVVHTPRFSENRVYFAPGPTTSLKKVDLKPSFEQLSDAERKGAVTHGQPLTVIVNSVGIPSEPSNPDRVYDLAVLLDVATGSDGKDTTIVVWYQRGVRPNQVLNFSNLIVYYEPSWDARVAPYFRLRLIDVAQERSKETREVLRSIGSAAQPMSTLVPNPLFFQAAGVAIRAASLVLANTSNELLLDYSVQFYSEQHIRAAEGAGLGALRRGPFIVAGRPEQCGATACGRDFWRSKLRFDWETNQILFADDKEVIAPYIQVTVATAESVVPKIVMERSAALFQRLTELGRGNRIEDIDEQSKALGKSIAAFVVNEKLRKYRTKEDAERVVLAIKDRSLSSEDVSFLIRTMSDLAGRTFSSVGDVTEWWESTGRNCTMKPAEFRLECPASAS